MHDVFQIHHPDYEKRAIELFVKRIDLPDPISDGNKKYKLKYNIEEAKKHEISTILTFGGAYSNHIVATAAICKQYNLNAIGVIRGDEDKALNPSLRFAKESGMHLLFISREKYRQKENIKFINSLKELFGSFFIIPEGGANALGVKGCTEILKKSDKEYNYVAVACGTGTTLAGLTNSLFNHQKTIGIATLNAKRFLEENIASYLGENRINQFQIADDYHFGGFAKKNNELLDFVTRFSAETGIHIEPIYTGKLFYGLWDMIIKDCFMKGDRILAIHTGGLQYLKLK